VVVAGVVATWVLVGIAWGAQTSLGAALQGEPQALSETIPSALHQSLPWIPGTLAVIWLATRFPVGRKTWRRHLAIHVLAMPVVAFGTNVLVVLGYWIRYGSFEGLPALVRQGALWGMVRLHLAAILYAAVAGLTQGVQYWRGMRRRELELARLEAQLANARLQVLSAQIRPHFLFNTLHAIGQLWRSGRGQEADQLLDHLGALFQKVIASTSRTQVTLAEELDMVRQYLAIEQARFGPRMTSRIDAEDAALGCLVPPLILQPLVENAVKHGVSRSLAAGEVAVEARVQGDRLLLRVRDDGPGQDGTGETSGMGTGLANVRDRLAGLYGEHHSLETSSGPEQGTEVRLLIPARDGA
jgi:two-component system, LytTR family, sensor kinase